MTTEFILRIVTASLLGGLIGLERGYRAKEAGFRTHFLVALGSAVFMIISQHGFADSLAFLPPSSVDPSRVAAQVVSGIGFIGAGIIIFQKHVVRGLTTAAGLWVTSAIGLAVGSGLYVLAATATILVLLCLEAMNFLLRRFGARSVSVNLMADSRDEIKQLMETLKHNGVEISSYTQHPSPSSQHPMSTQVTMELKMKRKNYEHVILNLIGQYDGIIVENIE